MVIGLLLFNSFFLYISIMEGSIPYSIISIIGCLCSISIIYDYFKFKKLKNDLEFQKQFRKFVNHLSELK